MVRGRRVRTVVGCNRIDDCCSPNPKRKDSGLVLNGNGINHFFQAANEITKGIEKSDNLLMENICEMDKDLKTFTEPSQKLNTLQKTNPNEIGTPVRNLVNVNGVKPVTPHRIELCSDSDDVQSAEEIAKPDVDAKPKAKKKLNVPAKANNNNHQLTEYFPVRRSVRKTKKTVMEEKQRSLENSLRLGKEEGLIVHSFDGKGRGVVASKSFEKGDFVVEYSGDLIDIVEAKKREQIYAQDKNTGCYMYYFKYNNQQYCIDATAETGRLGRLVNHSRNGNLVTRTVCVDGRPRLVLIAKTSIKQGDEITYDYGDRSKESLQYHPWLAY